MNTRLSFLPQIVLLTTTAIFTVASPAKPSKSPEWTRYAPEGTLLGYYDRLPAKHFAGFGTVSRRSLLKRKGAIVDYKRKFIEIPGQPQGQRGIHKLQMSLLPHGKEPWVAVSRIVWAQTRVPGTLNFYYGYNDAGGLREASSDFFPYQLKFQREVGAFEVAHLPRQGLTIEIGVPGGRGKQSRFTYNPKAGFQESFFRRTG